MLIIDKKFRNTYFSEDIIMERAYTNGQWENTVETIQNAVENNQISNQAVVFGNGLSRKKIDNKLIVNHLGGVLGSKSLQTYGCNAIYREHVVDFLVVLDPKMAKELSDSGYATNNIVYTRVLNTLEYPNLFYLIPNDPYADAGTTAAYIAAFDGHKKIFLLGFDGQDTQGINNNIYAGTNGYDSLYTDIQYNDIIWKDNLYRLFSVYDDVDFVWVTEAGRSTMHESWKYLTNVRQISFHNFVIEASI